ncbi:restriction endonuclease subunit S [Lacticaseibacillus rhamnosus]|uniref:restriction endonuclease subunit S n=1 Tax=Lacticaseibacillus rhamnosus TaxID=47715 RepID=UPI0007E39862|nr:restriction endonuclease subunit S [Lacticaseibacillus rhamnosus]
MLWTTFDFRPVNAWEKRKLGEIADIRGGGTPNTSKPEYWDGEIDWYAPAEIGTQRYVSGSRRQITNLGLNKSSATMLPANKTILFTSRAGIGNAAILTKSGATNQGFQSIVVKPATDIYFLYSEVPEIKRKAIRLAAGSTFLEISGKSLSKIQIWLPSFKEQSRIGHLFLQIDNLIAATQDKLDHFEEIKKALLKHLFDQSMRFKGYSDPWEKRKLGELSNIRRGASPRPISSKKWFSETSSIGWLRISDVTEQNGRIYHVAQHLSKEGQEKTLVLTTKHLILSIAATVGKPVQNYIALGIHDGFIVFLNPKFDLDFMFYFLEDYQPKWSRFGQPGSQVNINSELVRELEINVPREDEQKKISHVLLNVDNLIAATQSKLSSLESLKKALLQGLFI